MVKLAVKMHRHARRIWWSTPRASVLLAGIALLPTQSGSISLLAPREQLRAIEGLPGRPQVRAVGPSLYGDFVPPAGGLDPALTFGFSESLVGPAEAQGPDSVISASANGTVSDAADQFSVGGSATRLTEAVEAPTPVATGIVCEQLPQQLQAFGEYWNNHSVAGPPVRLSANISADPVRGPSGDPSNLPWPGPAGAWCRPLPLPFADSSPLASRAFWTPVAFVLFGIAVLWLSRGVKLPP